MTGVGQLLPARGFMSTARTRSYQIRDVRAIRALSSPLRQSILDLVVGRGPLSVADLAKELSRPADRLYYHVRVLQRAGLLLARPDVAGSGRAETRFDVPGRPMLLKYTPDVTSRRRAITRVIR